MTTRLNALAYGVVLFLFFSLPFSAMSQTPKRTESVEQGLLRASVLLRLDRTEATDTVASDRGSEAVIADINRSLEKFAVIVSNLGNSARHADVQNAREALEDILALIPTSDQAFARVVNSKSSTAPKLAAGLRRAIQRALDISATRPQLRIHALRLVHQLMETHATLAGGSMGKEFLSTFSIWLAELTGWRYIANQPTSKKSERPEIGSTVTAEETALIVKTEALYKKSFHAMLCARLFISMSR